MIVSVLAAVLMRLRDFKRVGGLFFRIVEDDYPSSLDMMTILSRFFLNVHRREGRVVSEGHITYTKTDTCLQIGYFNRMKQQ